MIQGDVTLPAHAEVAKAAAGRGWQQQKAGRQHAQPQPHRLHPCSRSPGRRHSEAAAQRLWWRLPAPGAPAMWVASCHSRRGEARWILRHSHSHFMLSTLDVKPACHPHRSWASPLRLGSRHWTQRCSEAGSAQRFRRPSTPPLPHRPRGRLPQQPAEGGRRHMVRCADA